MVGSLLLACIKVVCYASFVVTASASFPVFGGVFGGVQPGFGAVAVANAEIASGFRAGAPVGSPVQWFGAAQPFVVRSPPTLPQTLPLTPVQAPVSFTAAQAPPTALVTQMQPVYAPVGQPPSDPLVWEQVYLRGRSDAIRALDKLSEGLPESSQLPSSIGSGSSMHAEPSVTPVASGVISPSPPEHKAVGTMNVASATASAAPWWFAWLRACAPFLVCTVFGTACGMVAFVVCPRLCGASWLRRKMGGAALEEPARDNAATIPPTGCICYGAAGKSGQRHAGSGRKAVSQYAGAWIDEEES